MRSAFPSGTVARGEAAASTSLCRGAERGQHGAHPLREAAAGWHLPGGLLQRHSDHHANPTRRYQALRSFDEAPVLPTGYAGMIVLALLPPLWRRVMDPRVAAHFDGDLSLANIDPRRGERILAGAAAAPSCVGVEARREAPDEVSCATCPGCGYRYEVAAGDEHEGFAAGTAWADIPDDWSCPDCGVRDKLDFVVEPA